MSTAVLYQWPSAAHFGRPVPKTKFYEHGKVTASVREKFVAEVQKIIWAYKLADSTIHLRGTKAVPEIQIFTIDAKGDGVSESVLAAIDRAVSLPVVFEINRNHGSECETRMSACHKDLGDPKPKMSAYFSNPWLPANTTRSPLPQALDLPSLYSGLLAPMLPVAARAGESLAEATARVDKVRKLEREIATLERKLRTEPQLNRKVDLRRELKDRETALSALSELTTPTARNDSQKDAQWTS